jgi:hypothetical protein
MLPALPPASPPLLILAQAPSAVLFGFPSLPVVDAPILKEPVVDESTEMEDFTQPSPAYPASFLLPTVPPVCFPEVTVDLVQRAPTPNQNSVAEFLPAPAAQKAVAASKLEMYDLAPMFKMEFQRSVSLISLCRDINEIVDDFVQDHEHVSLNSKATVTIDFILVSCRCELFLTLYAAHREQLGVECDTECPPRTR